MFFFSSLLIYRFKKTIFSQIYSVFRHKAAIAFKKHKYNRQYTKVFSTICFLKIITCTHMHIRITCIPHILYHTNFYCTWTYCAMCLCRTSSLIDKYTNSFLIIRIVYFVTVGIPCYKVYIIHTYNFIKKIK